MSTQTTFDGFMELDADSLTTRLQKWLEGLGSAKTDWPGTAVVLHRDVDAPNYQTIVDLPITSRPTSATVLRDEIRASIVAKKGPDPVGYFRVRICRRGERASPDVDFHRRVGDMDLNQRSQVEIFKELYQRERARNNDLVQQMLAQHNSTTVLLGSWGTSITTLASARATGSIGADMGSPMAILGMIAWVLFFPSMKRAMGLPADADMLQVVRAGQVLLERAVAGGENRLEAQPQPVFRIEDEARAPATAPATAPAEDRAAPSGAPSSPAAAPAWDVDEVLDRAERDAAWRERLVSSMRTRAPLMARLKQLALEALTA